MTNCYNCGAQLGLNATICPKCGASVKCKTYTNYKYNHQNGKDEGIFALGFVLSLFFSGPLVWLIALIAEKEETRKGAFWCTVVQILLGILIAFIY